MNVKVLRRWVIGRGKVGKGLGELLRMLLLLLMGLLV